MNNSFSSFQQDLALEQDSRHFDDEKHITRSDVRAKKNAENNNEGGLKNLGLAIMVIFQTKRSALRKAMANLDAESAVSASLRSLIKHVETADADDQGELAIAKMREVYRPFLDKIIKKSDPDKETAFLVLEWLLLKFPYRTLMVRALGEDLSPSNDKKRKLAVLVAIEDAIDTQIRPQSTSGKEGATKSKSKSKSKSKLVDEEPGIPVAQPSNDPEKPVEPLADGKTLSAWMASLSTIVQNDGAFAPDGSRSMTRLTSLAMDIAIEISRTLAEQTLQEIKVAEDKEKIRQPVLVVELDSQGEDKHDEANAEDTQPFGLGFVRGMKSMQTIIKYFLLSAHDQVHIATAGMTDILDMLVRFNRHHMGGKALPSREIMFSFAQSWKLISVVLVKRRLALPSEEILKQAQTYLQMNEIPPYLRLLTTGLLLGYCGPPSQFDTAAKTSSEARSTLLGLANVVILENIPVGQATAIAIQTSLVPMLSEAEVQDMKTKVIAILDNPSDISLGSANLASSYMAVYPELFVPKLLARLRREGQSGSVQSDKIDVRKTMNSLYVVEAMAERNFFEMVLSKQAGDLRRKLEDLVIDLFREKDVSIRVTLGQIVASLNPTKIIAIYGPEINSTDSIVRSRAESVLIECMLSQRRDASMSDGFAVFLEYIRRVGRLGANHKGASTKIKTPSQLVSKIQSLNSNTAPPNAQVDSLDRLLRVVKILGETIPSTLWGSLFSELVAKSCGSPSDPILSRAWSQLSLSIVKSANAVSVLFVLISDILEQQGELTEEMLEAALDASDESLDDLRLGRLAPLAILKTLPVEQLKEQVHLLTTKDNGFVSVAERLSRLLRSRVNNANEFGSVKKQAEELAGDLSPDLNTTLHR
ncbi:hypothetical protein K457DRAFT_132014 [Linnemannia elongata AG-77]|uniref:Uncharacterized protein n=1 Tax=Linnemannia elongata AG-77 TaxID=1314771 RepID=A0A197KET1_9FUNG|nr:hypothetical protein K457DRAFT_132014 [Linnemannia elongata AG-77]